MKKLKVLQILIPVAVALIITIAYVANVDLGTLSSFGWSSISLICPLGALMAMLGAKTLIPRAVIALVVGLVLLFFLGRAFCAWICPIPVMQKFRDLVSRIFKEGVESDSKHKAKAAKAQAAEDQALEAVVEDAPVKVSGCGSCTSCAEKRKAFDSRHIILGGSLFTALVFGFPVFCLICPVGLTFGTIFLVCNLFGAGDVTWSVIVVPVLLLVEIIFFKKWCGKFCPLSAFMSLTNKVGKFWRPKSDNTTCREVVDGKACGNCKNVCPVGIDPHHPEESEVDLSECTKCLRCVESCPTNSITLPFLPPKEAVQEAEAVPVDSGKNE